MPKMEGSLAIGSKVDIQRSDGRIHSAMVSAINYEGQVITVEWYEIGETKGKEIELEHIYALNPHLHNPQTPASSQSSRRLSVPTKNDEPPVRPQRALRAKSLLPAPRGRSNGSAKTPADENVPPLKALENVKQQEKQQAPGRRKSNCVKEVERLKKNREERRAMQQEAKSQKERYQQELDPGNPNWEFLKMIREFQEELNIQAITMNDPIQDHQICVCVRKRPLNKKEKNKKELDIVTCPDKQNMVVHECKLKVDLTKYLENHKFRFDYSFNESASNELVYRYTAKPLVESIFNQGMATCFAYGQTGSGKTHTMGGDFVGRNQDCTKGIYALAAADVFKLLKSTKYKAKDLVVSSSFFEIYSGKVFDLLNKRKKLRVLEDGQGQVQVVNLQETIVHSVDEVLRLIEKGMKERTSGQTSANQNSSRSHAVLQIILRNRGVGKAGGLGRLYGKFSLIDLAGNERGADTSTSNRQTRMEGAEINKSLLALKECIRALGRKGAHLPFRASKLTQVLRDSFIGERAKTCMIATISPGLGCTEHTLNTLRYADRVKELGPDDVTAKKNSASEDDSGPPVPSDKYRNMELAMLCTQSDNADAHDELYNFHEAVSLLIDTEEQLIEEHKSSIEESFKMLDMEQMLVERVENDVDCDLEEYVQKLDEILTQKIEKFTHLREKVGQFKEQLFEEERASKNVKRLPFV